MQLDTKTRTTHTNKTYGVICDPWTQKDPSMPEHSPMRHAQTHCSGMPNSDNFSGFLTWDRDTILQTPGGHFGTRSGNPGDILEPPRSSLEIHMGQSSLFFSSRRREIAVSARGEDNMKPSMRAKLNSA